MLMYVETMRPLNMVIIVPTTMSTPMNVLTVHRKQFAQNGPSTSQSIYCVPYHVCALLCSAAYGAGVADENISGHSMPKAKCCAALRSAA
eukprot:822006-Pyramimonas_sp.AAC.1